LGCLFDHLGRRFDHLLLGVRGLSEVPLCSKSALGVPTIGTGLGNARFTNRNGKGER
jgi:hypothetical protein